MAITACGGPAVSGQPTSAPETSSTSDTAASSSSPTSGGSLEDTDPCSFLTKSEAEQLTGAQRKDPAPEKLGSARVCGFSPESASFGIGIRTNVGLAGVQPNGGVIEEIVVGRHQAKQLLGATGSCGIYIGVTDSSRVDVVLNSGSSDKDPCPLARQIAEFIEPRLP
ncbi:MULTISPECIES: DUF3558 domain-containing protein [Saccharothrix]|uniref:DUF3558 domain-containing protein n=1 Tax=Saccharothrix TaxID=2071 RepID=UPI000939D11B|nr:DUF3558 domain-containing protein [Saccharothrix sp. CB00851]